MNTEVMFSSKTPEWETPREFFRALDAEFHFTVDVCATKENAKCPVYFDREQDGLAKEWRGGYSGATHHTGARLANGYRKRHRLPAPSLCCFRPEQTQHGFTTTSTATQRSASFAAVSSSEMERTAHRSHLWCVSLGGTASE